CCDRLQRDEAHADALARLVADSGLPVMMAVCARFTSAAQTLRALLARRAARVRLVACTVTTPASRRRTREAHVPPGGCGSLALLDWCTSLVDGVPSHVLAAGLPDGALDTLVLRYDDGRAIQINRYRGPGTGRSVRVKVITDAGTATGRL